MLLLDSASDFLNDATNEMEGLTKFLKFAIVATVAIPLIALYVRANKTQALAHKTQALAHNFKALGDMTGIHKDVIIAKVGAPNAINAMYGGELLQWVSPGYRIAIKFDTNGNFVGIQSEYAN